MTELPKPTADLVISIESPYADSREMARMTLDLEVSMEMKAGQFVVTFDQDRFVQQAVDALELMVREIREEIPT